MDKRIVTYYLFTYYTFYGHVHLKQLPLLGEISFLKKDHLRTFDFFSRYEQSVLISM